VGEGRRRLVGQVFLFLELLLVVAVVETLTDGGVLLVIDVPLAIACGVVLASAWLTRVFAALFFYMRRGAFSTEKRRWPRLLVEPILAIVVLACVYTPYPFEARVLASSSALRACASAARSGQLSLPLSKPRWAGLFRVREIDVAGQAVRFITSHCSLFDDCGLVYSADGPPPKVGEDFYTKLKGPWYHWYRSF
jgi:hypothetical protein